MINLDNWDFGTNTFPSAEAFCEYISVNGRGFQSRLQKMIMSDPVYQNWKRLSPTLKKMPYYKRYRKSEESKKFYTSSVAIKYDKATNKDHKRCNGLKNEIINSPIILKSGQKIFHGRYFDINNTNFQSSYPINSFLSCTLCPEVATFHALSKAAKYCKNV